MKTINNIDDLSESAINKLYSFRNWADKMSEKCPEDGKECIRFDNYIDAEKRGMYRHLIKKSVDTGKPYKGILYKEEK